MNTLLVLTVVVLIALVIARIVRIVEISNELSGSDDSAINDSDNRFNSRMLIVILIATIGYFTYTTMRYKRFLLPESASEHGHATDQMFWITMALIVFMFFVTQILLFWFGYKYAFKKENKAFFFPDNHKIELIWTAVPAVVLIALVGYGLIVWNRITDTPPDDAVVIELYGKQFDWTVRYAGKDNNLGKTNFRKITGTNIQGILEDDANGNDDVVTKELHLPVNKNILLVMHSRDVIHSVYLPHFHTQMNCLPGMTTQFHFKPVITTEEMKKITKDENFHYILLCNKICGVAHYNMKLEVICESESEFDTWMKTQKTVAENRAAEKAQPVAEAK